jgi:CubicO group peptidase (beta-lactamase class C family)
MPQKIPFPASTEYTSPLPRMTPEEAGVPSDWLYNLYSTLEKDSEAVLHTVIFVRHGAVVAEASFRPYSTSIWHASHSMCKSITALAVGILAESGKIDISAPVYEYITEARTLLPFSKYKSITVDNLLSMSSGVSFAEAGSVTNEDWLRGFFESAVKMEPGTDFSYNSMNTYVLGAIVSRITGMSLADYVQQNIFAPMGITTSHWEMSPTGLTKAGWGLYMLPEDMAKIGLLFLRRGVWEDKTLVPASWIDYITKKSFDTPESMGRYGYGRHVWIGPRPGSYVCNGLFGQNIIILPDLDSVIVTTGAVDSLFQTCRITDIFHDMLIRAEFSDKQLPPDNAAYTMLNNYLKSLGEYPINTKNELQTHSQTPQNSFLSRITSIFSPQSKKTAHTDPRVPLFCRNLNGVSYDFRGDNVGIIPLTCQMI